MHKFIETINKLYEFLHIFKSDLMGIEIDKKENGDFWMCDLVMVYDSYKIHAEFESTGIKKLIKLFVYVRELFLLMNLIRTFMMFICVHCWNI